MKKLIKEVTKDAGLKAIELAVKGIITYLDWKFPNDEQPLIEYKEEDEYR